MTNTDRLAQFIEQMDMLAADFYKYQEGDPKVPFVIVRDATAIALSEYADVRASLAPAAVEGDDISWRVKWLRQARINNADETDNKWLLELADRVAALAAQCEADTRDAKLWRALLSCKRIRILGTAGFGDGNINGLGHYRHFGAEFWTRYGEDVKDAFDGAQVITEFATEAAAIAAGNGEEGAGTDIEVTKTRAKS